MAYVAPPLTAPFGAVARAEVRWAARGSQAFEVKRIESWARERGWARLVSAAEVAAKAPARLRLPTGDLHPGCPTSLRVEVKETPSPVPYPRKPNHQHRRVRGGFLSRARAPTPERG